MTGAHAVENTAHRNPLLHLAGMLGGTENYLDELNVAGQHQMAQSSTLPAQASPSDWESLEALGVERLGPVANDDLFVHVKFPDGWHIERGDDPRHTLLHDAEGLQRASISYDAKFYDRWANWSYVDPYAQMATRTIDSDGELTLPADWPTFDDGQRASYRQEIARTLRFLEKEMIPYTVDGDRKSKYRAQAYRARKLDELAAAASAPEEQR